MTDLRLIPDFVHSEMRNWARWCWMGAYPHPLPPTSCGSAEGDYRSIGENATDDARPIPPNETNALIVDRIWRGLPFSERLVVKIEYPARHEYDWSYGRVGVCRRIKMPLRDYEAKLFAGLSRVWDEFDRLYRN